MTWIGGCAIMSNDKIQQEEELVVLTSIYGEEWQTVDRDSHIYKIDIYQEHVRQIGNLRQLTFQVILPSDYPSSSPPVCELHAPWMADEEIAIITSRLEAIFRDNVGELVLYQWIECIRDHLNSLPEDTDLSLAESSGEKEQLKSEISADDDVDADLSIALELPVSGAMSKAVVDDGELVECPQIAHGEPLTDRRSTFQAHIAPVTSQLEVRSVMKCLLENRKIANATHNVMAYRIYDGGKNVWYQHCSDDGESAAGGRLLHLLQILKVQGVVVVVTRWYGGIHLGPDRFKHYSNCARDLLQSNGYLQGKSEDTRKSAHKSQKPKKRK